MKTYADILVERLLRATENLMSEEQGAVISGIGCANQIFTLKKKKTN